MLQLLKENKMYEQNVDHIQFEADRFLYRITRDKAPLSHPGMLQYFLSADDSTYINSRSDRERDIHILVQHKSSKHREAAVQRDGLCDGKTSHTKRESHRRQRTEYND